MAENNDHNNAPDTWSEWVEWGVSVFDDFSQAWYRLFGGGGRRDSSSTIPATGTGLTRDTFSIGSISIGTLVLIGAGIVILTLLLRK